MNRVSDAIFCEGKVALRIAAWSSHHMAATALRAATRKPGGAIR